MPVYAVLPWVGKKDGEGLMAQGSFPEWIMGSGGYSVFCWLQFYKKELLECQETDIPDMEFLVAQLSCQINFTWIYPTNPDRTGN